MPAYTAIHIGFVGADAVSAALAALGITLKDGTHPTGQDLLGDADCFCDETDADKLAPLIHEAYMAIAKRLDWTHLLTDRLYHDFETPYGKRRTRAFTLSFEYDPTEIGDEPKDCSLGINLSSRYYPVVLDISSPNGGLHPSFDLNEVLACANICKEEIVKHLPAFDTAHIYLRETFA